MDGDFVSVKVMHPAIIRSTTLQDQKTDCVGVCRRCAWWIGFAPKTHAMRNVIWLCDHKQCHAVARRFFAMSAEQFDERARRHVRGRSQCRGYLDEFGQ